MTPEDEKRLEMIGRLSSDGNLCSTNDTGFLLMTIADLRHELHGYQAAAEEEARVVDEQVENQVSRAAGA